MKKKNPIITALIGTIPAIITALKRGKPQQAVPASAYGYTQDLPSWAKYLTLDSDGSVTAHEQIPEARQEEKSKYTYWVSEGRNEEVTASVIIPKVWRVKK